MKKIISIVVLAFFILVLNGCTTNKNDETLKIGMEANYAPFNWTLTGETDNALPISNSSTGEYADGYDVQIAKHIKKELDIKIEIVKLEWDALILNLKSNDIDLIIAGMSPTEERKLEIDFSDEYYRTQHVVLMQKGSPYSSATKLEDFADAKGVSQQATAYDDLLGQIAAESLNFEHLNPVGSISEVALAITSGVSDITVMEKPVADALLKTNPGLEYIEFNDFDLDEADKIASVGMRKNSPLKDDINRALSTLTDDERTTLMTEAVERQDLVAPEKSFFGKVVTLVKRYSSQLLDGVKTTLTLALLGTIFGLVLGFVLAMCRTFNMRENKNNFILVIKKILYYFAKTYVTIFRGTPMIVQAMIIYYGMAAFDLSFWTPMVAGIITVTLNTAAYLSEVLRGGITNLDIGQTEAARSLGFNQFQTFVHIVIPQALKNTFPSIGNEFIVNIKDTSVLSVIMIADIFFYANSISGATYLFVEAMCIAAVIYLILTYSVSKLLMVIEKRMNMPVKEITSAN